MIKKFVIGTAPFLICGITIAMASPTASEVSFPEHFSTANLQLAQLTTDTEEAAEEEEDVTPVLGSDTAEEAAGTSGEAGDPTLADPMENKGQSPSAREIEYPDEPAAGDEDAAEREPFTSEEHVGLEDEPRREEIGEEGMTSGTGAMEMEDETVDVEREPFTSKETTGIDPTPRVDE